MIPKTDYKNRLTDGMPRIKCTIQIITPCSEGEETHICIWTPYKRSTPHPSMGPGYEGTAAIRGGNYAGIGFHAWTGKEHDFVYYKVLR